MMSTKTNEFLQQVLQSKIKERHDELLKNIVEKWGTIGEFTLEELQNEFPCKIRYLEKENKKRTQKKRIKFMREFYELCKKNKKEGQCIARTMQENGQVPPFVYYCKKEKRWIVGTQCTRMSRNDSDYCGIHQKTLPFGRFDRPIPLDTYERFMYSV